MEALKISVEVSLSDATLEKLKQIAGLMAASNIVKSNPDAAGDLCKALSEKEDEKKPEAPVAETKAPVDLPAEPDEDIPNTALFEAVKAAQKERGVSPAAVKAVFADYGIASSRECPKEKRAELLNRINSL